MSGLGWQAWMTLATLAGMVWALAREWARPAYVFLGVLAVLLVAGVLTPEEAFVGFSNSAVLIVGSLFVVAAGIERTQALSFLNRMLFGRSTKLSRALPRLTLSTSLLSGVISNTPIVAMFIPRVQDWAERRGLHASKLLIPLSYAAITGGMLTLIGSSTHLIVSGLMETGGYEGLGLFSVTWVGVPASLAVAAYFALGGHRLLPARQQQSDVVEEGLAECLFELKVADRSPLIGRSIEEAKLRDLERVYLVHLERQDHLIPSNPGELLQAGDVLTFAGQAEALDRLLERPGLSHVLPPAAPVEEPRTLPLYEAVIASTSNLVGKTLREAGFREQYGGVVLGIQRKDEQQRGPLGRTPLQAGDLLLVEAQNGFAERWNASRDEFYLVASRRPERPASRKKKAPIALGLMASLLVAVGSGVVPLVTAAFAAALLMVASGCLTGAEARESVDVPVLVIIAAALGVGKAVEVTGLADLMARGLLWTTDGLPPVLVVALLYLLTNVLVELVTTKTAAVIMLPVALACADALGANPTAFGVTVTIAAAASFLTPIGFQTNLMVMTPGGYRYSDYFRVGLPLALIIMAVTVTTVALVWL